MPPKRTKKVRLGIYCTHMYMRPSEHDIVVISGQRLVDTASDWLTGPQLLPASRTRSDFLN